MIYASQNNLFSAQARYQGPIWTCQVATIWGPDCCLGLKIDLLAGHSTFYSEIVSGQRLRARITDICGLGNVDPWFCLLL